MAFTRYLVLDIVTKELFQFIPGSGPSGSWTLFPVQPPLQTNVGYGCCGLRDGSIIVYHYKSTQATYYFLHYDPLTLTWVERAVPPNLNFPSEIYCVGPAGIDAITGGGAGRIGGYNGTTQLWSQLGAFEVGQVKVTGRSLTDVWAAWSAGGTGELRHFDGSIWTNHRAEVAAFLGWSPWQFYQVHQRDDGVLHVTVSGGPTFVTLLRRSAGVWSIVLQANGPFPYIEPERGLYSVSDDLIFMTGPNGYGNDDWLFRCASGSLVAERKIGQYVTSAMINAITSYTPGALLVNGTRYNVGELGITESSPGGWVAAGYQPPLYGWNPTQITPGVWSETTAPVISNKLPAPGATGVALSTPVSFDATDLGSGIDVSATTISLAGTPAWAADAPLPGFTGSRTPIAGGYHYSINRISGWLPGEAVAVAVHAEDTVGNAVNASWSFTATTFAATSLDPSLIDELGGTSITILGLFPLGETFSVYLGPVVPGNLCYSGRQGYGSHPESDDGLVLQCVSVPSAIGVQTVTVVRDSNLAVSTLPITVVERHHQSKRLSTRACHPPWAGVGPRRIEED